MQSKNSPGGSDAGAFQYGATGWKPVAGRFGGPGNQQLLAGEVQGALARLTAAGVDPGVVRQLGQAQFTPARLPAGEVGVTVGSHVDLYLPIGARRTDGLEPIFVG